MANTENEYVSTGEYGILSREISAEIAELVENVMKQTMKAATAEIKMPEKPMLAEQEVPKNSGFPEGEVMLEKTIKAALPAILTAIGIGLGANPVILVLLAGGGGVFSAQIGKNEEVTMQPVSVFDPESLKAEVAWDQEALDQTKQMARERIDTLKAPISALEKKYNEINDISLNCGFGEWIQQFLLYCDSKLEDQQLRMLRNMLISQLACMKISVYDTLKLNAEGKPDVPYLNYLMDKRREEAYTEVTVPAVYSDKAILARGEVR